MRESDIDAHLKRAFKELADEGLPDRFNDLLAQLRHGDAGNARHESTSQDGVGHDAADQGGAGAGRASTPQVNGASRKKLPVGEGAGIGKGARDDIVEPVTADKPGARHRR